MKRIVIFVGSVTLASLACYLALMLGAWGFAYRRYSMHETRLARLRSLHPTLDQVVQGLRDEGSPLVDTPRSRDELEVAARRGGRMKREILDKSARWPQTRVFLAGDMVYFIYFDGRGIMQDFTCVAR